ncbi:PRP1 splicing factor, N-terminal-domain-containing protein [Syncephalis fuscata]|nr:PRP1 splicing factor, N-terminal-domain-containing protein [Syncephalis fuscata]
MGKAAPPNYVAGLGRGATGFTTRSDIGPAREPPSEAAMAAAAAQMQQDKETEPDQYQDPDNEVGLFSSIPYEEDDEEADRIYDEVDKTMDERRRVRREAREKEELLRYRKERPKIQQQFADLKRGLADVTDDEWANLPEVGDLVGKNRRARANRMGDRFTPLPDSVLLRAKESSQMTTMLDESEQKYGNSGLATPMDSGTMTDFIEIGQARDKMLGMKLDQASDSVTGQSVIDPKGYLTNLDSVIIKNDAEIGDIKKARLLLKSVITTNPKHAPGWIAATRLEEVAGKLAQARNIITQGCEECPKNEDVWLEAARLNSNENAKIILANAVRQIPQSVKIWLQALQLESDPAAKKRVLRRALELIPNSVKLWKAAVSMEENPDDARILLSRAVELVPLSVELWLALARLETYDNARKVLNRARTTIRTSHEIWIAAARLEEENGVTDRVEVIISRAVSDLSKLGTVLGREQWLQEAEACERQGSIATCQAIVKATVGLGVEEEDRKSTWVEDAESCIARGHIQTARAIYAHALSVFPAKKSLWRRAAFLEKEHGTSQLLEELLRRAVQYCPQAEILWLMLAKEKWVSNDVDGARAVLSEAFKANTNSEQIWLAAIKLESENGEYDRARVLLEKAREQANTQRVWMKSVVLERQHGRTEEALKMLDEALKRFPTFDKLWMIRGQIFESMGQIPKAREAFVEGCRQCPRSITLWILSARLEEQAGVLIKARALLERARLRNPKEPALWRESVAIERRAGNTAVAKALLAKALQECPNAGMLWSDMIFMEPRPMRKSKSVDALKKCDNDPVVIIAVARLFWAERKLDKARTWFSRACKLDPDNGDAWAWWFKFECQQGTQEQREEVQQRCLAAEPRHGDHWQPIAKDIRNVGKRSGDLLPLVAAELE